MPKLPHIIASFAFVFQFLVGPLPADCRAQEKPNIILIMADDLGWGDPTFNDGWIETPALDALASAGIKFNRFYSASAVCSPTRASCLTGRNPHRVGVPGANRGKIGQQESLLSEVLSDIGYTTGHFGKWHLGTLTTLRKDSNRGDKGKSAVYSAPWHHGYDDCFVTEAKVPTFHPMRKTKNELAEPASFQDPAFYGTYYWRPPKSRDDWETAAEGTLVSIDDNLSGDDSRVIMDRVIPFIEAAVSRQQPFFSVVWFHTPHKPLVDPEAVAEVDSVDAYTDAIAGMDQQIGRLQQTLADLHVDENTMIWFCSDNGPENGVGKSGPYRARKRSLYEGGVRVPGLLVWPAKIQAGRVTDFPAVTSDYYPTITDYLGIEVPDQKPLDGISLRPMLEDQIDRREQPIGFIHGKQRSWVRQQFKLITRDEGDTFQLFDLLADPGESADLASSRTDTVSRMKLELQGWLNSVSNDSEFMIPESSRDLP